MKEKPGSNLTMVVQNRQPALGVCYYPEHWPEKIWKEDARRMVACGISWVRIGEFAWSRIESKPGNLSWAWLDRSIEILTEAGLSLVLGTPTATPPHWLVKKYPDMLAVDKNGHERKFGSRRHYCFSHTGYRKEAARIAMAMAKRYGKHPQVRAWQIDNEYGCHETTLSYSKAARRGFQQWLKERYTSIDALNHAWGNVFWSMEVADFEDIDLPNQTVTNANPSHLLSFHRYSSDQVVAFNRAQVEAMRPFTQQPLLHNYMGRITSFDHFEVGKDLDIATWDSYPCGFLEMVLEENEEWKQRYYRQGDPDFQAFHHDLYRRIGRGRFWVMEQQPGPVNWGRWNPIPLPGMVRLWGMEAVAHGAEVVSYFRWRQAPFGQEQMHAGLLEPDGEEAQGFHEVKQLARDLQQTTISKTHPSEVTLIFDYPSSWAWSIQPQGQTFDYFRLLFDHYRALRRLGLSIDFCSSNDQNLENYKLVVIAGLLNRNPVLDRLYENSDHVIFTGPRCFSKTTELTIPPTPIPNIHTIEARVKRVSTLRPGATIALSQGGYVKHWFEELAAKHPLETTTDGSAVVVGDQRRMYCGSWLDETAMNRVMKNCTVAAGIKTTPLPEGLRQRQMGDKTVRFNYNDESVTFDNTTIAAADFVLLP